jgi:hypothetical protein
MSHQHLESRGHIFTNRANIAYLPTRLRSSRNNDRGTTNNVVELRRCRSDAVADSYSINDALHPDTSHQLYNIMLVSLQGCIGSCGSVSVFVRGLLPSLTDTKTMGSHKQVASYSKRSKEPKSA